MSNDEGYGHYRDSHYLVLVNCCLEETTFRGARSVVPKEGINLGYKVNILHFKTTVLTCELNLTSALSL